jgi:hypothetical protein
LAVLLAGLLTGLLAELLAELLAGVPQNVQNFEVIGLEQDKHIGEVATVFSTVVLSLADEEVAAFCGGPLLSC